MKYVCLIGAAVTAIAAATLMSAPAFATPSWTASGKCDDPGCSGTVKILGSTYTAATPGQSNGSDVFEIEVIDNFVNPPSQGDLVSGVLFSLSQSFKSASVTPATATSQHGQLINITSNSTAYTPISGTETHWGAGVITHNCPVGGSCVGLETAGAVAQNGKPIDMIVGQPGPGNIYSNANPGGLGGGGFNPLILGNAIFFVDVTGLSGTLAPTITGVTIAFGTGPDYFKKAVPEPLTLSLFGVGLAGAVALRRRPKKA